MSLAAGLALGDYRILEEIGRGGMAIVYKALQPGLEREVAIKVLPALLAAEDEALSRFRREARLVARLNHPHILTIYDYGEQNGLPYLVCELVQGGTLESRLATDGSPLSLHETISLLEPVADALDYAHRHGVLHRDVKPANILLTEDGVPVLADFGIARMLDPVSGAGGLGARLTHGTLTEPGLLQGTPAYMAPEHATSSPVGELADVYGLSVVAYQLLTGRLPFSGDTPLATLLAHVSAPLPAPRTLNPQLPEAADAALLKGLAKRPEDRFPTARALIAALEASGAGTAPVPPVVITPAPPPDLSESPRPSWSPLAIGSIALGLLLLVTVATLLFLRWLNPPLLDRVGLTWLAVAAGSAQRATTISSPAASRTSAVAPAILPTVFPTTAPVPTAAPAPTEPPPTATPSVDQSWTDVLDDLDSTWAVDWPRTLALIDAFRTQHPTYAPATQKLYSALVSYGELQLDQGSRAGGIAQFERARSLQPSRGEAVGALRALTPTATPRAASTTTVVPPTQTRPPAPAAVPPTAVATTVPAQQPAPASTATIAPTHAPTLAPTIAPTLPATATRVPPTPVPEPTAIPSPGAILLADTFDDPAKGVMATATSPAGAPVRSYENGVYVVRRPDPVAGTTAAVIPGIFRNSTLAFDARVVGDVQNRAISASCRRLTVSGNFSEYEFRMYPSPGTADLRRRDVGEAGAIRVTTTPLVAIKPYPAIKRGNEWNHVELTCAGDVIVVWVNAQSLISVRDTTHAEGSFALSLISESTVRAEAHFDNLVITQR